jgi:CRISPR-associated endonuclease Csn1
MSGAYDAERQKIEIPLPWPTLREDLEARLKAMTVSHRADHGAGGALHEDTAYGLVKDPSREDGANLVYRKTFRDLNEKEIARIRDRRLRDLLSAHVEAEKKAGKDLKAALHSFTLRTDMPGIQQPIRHVRLTKPEKPEYLVTIRDEAGRPYKAYSAGENAFVDIFELPDGKWSGEATSVFRANQRGAEQAWRMAHPDARFIMRVFKGDMLRIDHNGQDKIVRVVRLEPSQKRLRLVGHNEAGTFEDRHNDPNDPLRWIFGTYDRLKEARAERVRVDELGRLWRVSPDDAVRSLRQDG